MARRTAANWVPALLTVVAFVALAACDTGDGKQLQPYDPADYPSQATVPPTVEDEFSVVATGDTDQPGAELPGTAGPSGSDDAGGSIEPFGLVAPWLDGAPIDSRHTCDGLDVSPALSWGAVPPGTVEIAIAMVDDSAVNEGQPFVHWVIGGLDPAEIALVEGDVPPTAPQALNFFGDVGYGGPCPPPGDEPHLYRITAYALNQQLELADGDPATEFLATIATISIASADVTGAYQR